MIIITDIIYSYFDSVNIEIIYYELKDIDYYGKNKPDKCMDVDKY